MLGKSGPYRTGGFHQRELKVNTMTSLPQSIEKSQRLKQLIFVAVLLVLGLLISLLVVHFIDPSAAPGISRCHHPHLPAEAKGGQV